MDADEFRIRIDALEQSIDPVADLRHIADREGMRLHVDATSNGLGAF